MCRSTRRAELSEFGNAETLADINPRWALVHVALDTNVWVYETRLLRSPKGAAVLYAIEQLDASLLLPEIVEKEVRTHAVRLGTQAISKIKTSYDTIAALMGRRDDYRIPTGAELRQAVDDRFAELGSRIHKLPFSEAHARSALEMVFAETPPNGPKNQQFKDSAIWQALLQVAQSGSVFFVTKDKGFFEGRDPKAGLATPLREELEAAGSRIDVHYRAVAFLEATRKEIPPLDTDVVAAAIDRAGRKIIESSVEGKGVVLGKLEAAEVSLFLTERSGILAADFVLSYTAGLPDETLGRLDVEGSCNFVIGERRAEDLRLEQITGFDQDGARIRELGAAWIYAHTAIHGRRVIPYELKKPLEWTDG